MPWTLIGGYILAHFALYVCVLRYRVFFWTERGVFLLHFVSAAIILALTFAAFLWAPTLDSVALVFGAGAAHGIYSLTFLECWLLSEGGYSLRVLSELVKRNTATPAELEEKFVEMSARKKIGRLESMVRLGLVQEDGGRLRLTRSGRNLSNAMTLIAKIAGFRVSS